MRSAGPTPTTQTTGGDGKSIGPYCGTAARSAQSTDRSKPLPTPSRRCNTPQSASLRKSAEELRDRPNSFSSALWYSVLTREHNHASQRRSRGRSIPPVFLTSRTFTRGSNRRSSCPSLGYWGSKRGMADSLSVSDGHIFAVNGIHQLSRHIPPDNSVLPAGDGRRASRLRAHQRSTALPVESAGATVTTIRTGASFATAAKPARAATVESICRRQKRTCDNALAAQEPSRTILATPARKPSPRRQLKLTATRSFVVYSLPTLSPF